MKQKTAYEMRISDWSSDVCSSDLAVVIAAGRNHLFIIFGRRVEIVIVIIKPGVRQLLRLIVGQHPQSHAGLETERTDFAHHVADRVHVAILWFPPRRAHAEPFGPARLGFASRRDHRIDRHQLFSLEPGLEARALAAIRTEEHTSE